LQGDIKGNFSNLQRSFYDKTFALLFHLKKPKNYVKGPVPIYIRVTIDGDRLEINSTRQCNPENWSSVKGRMAGNKEEVKQLNNYLDLLQTKIYESQRELLSAGYEVTSLEEFIRLKHSLSDFRIKNLSHQFVTGYEFYLKSVQSLQHNTAMG
jgi:hypothetical protein